MRYKLLLWNVKNSYYYDRKYHTLQIFFCTLKMAGHGGFQSLNPAGAESVNG
jgi:hypothetical protein